MNWLGKLGSIPGLSEKAVEKALDKGLSLLESEVSRYRNVEEELGRLRRTSDRINSLLVDAEQRRYIEDESVKLWLRQLRSISFDTDNLIDEYQTALEVYRLQASFNAAGSSRKRKWYQIELPSISPEWGPIRKRFADEIERINTRLEEITKGRKTLRLRNEDGVRREAPNQRARIFQTGPCHDRSRMIGRQRETNDIVDLLTSDRDLVLPVVPIYGAAGIGKTTLARLVYEDERIDQYFKLKAWVSLTDGCDVRNIMKEICEKITKESCGFQAYETLQSQIRKFLQARKDDKFLLVIDNLWAEDFYFWEALRSPLLSGGKGSKVLITTRNEKICRIMHAVPQPSLEGLQDDECWQLLKSLAIPQVINDIDQERRQVLGNEIAKRCGGSPLAAKTLGAMLNGAKEEEWSDVLSEMRALKDDQNGVLATLKISYYHLSYHLKQCFAYCSIFPNGYKFERDQVIRYWMAEGLIESRGRQRLEAVGMRYFEELLWRSFFEKVPACDESQVERYKMPSLMYDLARSVMEYEFRGIESDLPLSQPKEDRDQARYAYLLHREDKPPVKLECIEQYQNLRTLKVCDEWGERVVPIDPFKNQYFHRGVNLRVLDMSNSNLKFVPDSIGELIHLRYLGLSNTKIRTLPEKICDLFNLQTLELRGCSELTVLPQGMCKLINLRHLDVHLDWDKEITDSTDMVIPSGFGDLKHIQTLSRFNVTYNAEECNFVELKDLNLRGDLCILNIERVPVKKPEDALSANLQGKQYIENLMLRWNRSAGSNKEQWQHSKKVIENLQPNNRLRILWVINYPGMSFPGWIGDPSFSSLETIRISYCFDFTFLPLLGKLPRLKNLQIDDVWGKNMDNFVGFPSLEHLKLLKLPLLERISLENDIPKLKKAYVSDCPDLKELAIHQNLRGKLEITECPNLVLQDQDD
ncbi:NBS-LRR-like resistance protein [Rhynchospora pubera]|uniref:NBS-LRR-like resistance protein n=1 Tax=Rhynchospora pubera TaxID=906938 RepID=A0AAV8FJ35_9POAL|nr:NBS-LRR-like resistance protein [Rhynchospora pubera]